MRYLPIRSFTMAALLGVAPHAVGAQVACPAASTHAAVTRRLQALVDSLAAASPDTPGMSLAVIGRGGCLQWAGSAGIADRATRARLTPAHTHRIASNTKTYTSAAALRLVEEGRLSLDDAMSRHLSPEHLASLKGDGYAVDAITVRQLLTHTAGIYDYAMDDRFFATIQRNPTHRWTRTEQLDSAMAWGAAYGAPGTTYHYTDTGYILLAEIIERVSSLPLAAAFRNLLHFERNGLRATWLETLEPQPSTAGPRAHQYLGDDDTYGFDASVDLYGGGGLVASPMDMARFNRALFTGGVFRHPSTLQVMTTTMGSTGAPRVYAAGLSQVTVRNAIGWGHSGFWNTWSYHFPSQDVTLAASLTQQTDGRTARALLEQTARMVFR